MKIKKACFIVCMVLVALSFLFAASTVRADGTWDAVVNNFPGSVWSIAYGNGTYVATNVQTQSNYPSTGSYRFTGRIYTSPDLATWTKQVPDVIFDGSGNIGNNGFTVMFATPSSDRFVAWAYCADSTGTVAASKILASANGTDWSEKYSGNDVLVGVSSIIYGYYSTHVTRTYDAPSNTTTLNYKIRFSQDLNTWTDRYAGTYSGSGSTFGYGFFISRYDEGYLAILYSANNSTSPSTITSKILFSGDGITWTERYTGSGYINVAGIRNTLAISEQTPNTGGTTTGRILITTDGGSTWTERYNQTFTGGATLSLASNNNDAFVGWIGINNAGQFNMKMLYSSDGVTWTNPYDQTFIGSGSMWTGYANPYFATRISMTSSGQTTTKLLLSPTGSAWTESYSGQFTSGGTFTLGYRNRNFLAWGWNGASAAILKYSGPVTVWLAGTVREGLTEIPISGATVSVVGNPSINTTTAADGRFMLAGIAPGTYAVKVTKDGYWPFYSDGLPYTPPGVPDFTVNTRIAGNFLLSTNSQVAGWGVAPDKGAVLLRLVDSATAATGLINGVTVTAVGQPSGKTYTASYFDAPYAFTGSSTFPNGRAFFLNVDGGDTLAINASATGWTFPQQTYAAFAGGVSGGPIIGLPTGATYPVSGVVKDFQSNLPLAGVTLKIVDVNTGLQKAQARTNESGYYLVSLLSPGNYTITASRPGYEINAYPSLLNLSDPSPNTTVNITMSVAQTPLYAEFTGDGLYKLNGTAWNLLTKAHPTTMLVAGSALFAYFAGDGFYQWGGSGWYLLTKDQPSAMLTSSSALYADFPAWGLYSWNGAVWIKLTSAHPQDMIATASTLFAYFTGDGLYSRTGSGWTQLTKVRPQSMVASGPILYAYFTGDGLYQWNGSWTLLTKDQPSTMLASSSTLYADFPGWGLYSWNGSAWTGLTSSHPTRMAASGSILYADFAGDGLYQWAGSTWIKLTKDHPTNMLASGSILYADFPGWGLYTWNGTEWGNNLTTSHPATMLMDPGN